MNLISKEDAAILTMKLEPTIVSEYGGVGNKGTNVRRDSSIKYPIQLTFIAEPVNIVY